MSGVMSGAMSFLQNLNHKQDGENAQSGSATTSQSSTSTPQQNYSTPPPQGYPSIPPQNYTSASPQNNTSAPPQNYTPVNPEKQEGMYAQSGAASSTQSGTTASPEMQAKKNHRMGEFGSKAATALAKHEAQKAVSDPAHASRHKMAEKLALQAAQLSSDHGEEIHNLLQAAAKYADDKKLGQQLNKMKVTGSEGSK